MQQQKELLYALKIQTITLELYRKLKPIHFFKISPTPNKSVYQILWIYITMFEHLSRTNKHSLMIIDFHFNNSNTLNEKLLIDYKLTHTHTHTHSYIYIIR